MRKLQFGYQSAGRKWQTVRKGKERKTIDEGRICRIPLNACARDYFTRSIFLTEVKPPESILQKYTPLGRPVPLKLA